MTSTEENYMFPNILHKLTSFTFLFVFFFALCRLYKRFRCVATLFFSKTFTTYTTAKQEVVSRRKAGSKITDEVDSCSEMKEERSFSELKSDFLEAKSDSSSADSQTEEKSENLDDKVQTENRNKLLSDSIREASPCLDLLVENRLGRITDGLLESGSYFSINSFAPKRSVTPPVFAPKRSVTPPVFAPKRSVTPPVPDKKISYCDSDDENSASSSAFANEMRYPYGFGGLEYGSDRLSPNGSLFQYDRPFAKTLNCTNAASDDDSGSLFEEDKRFEWVDRIWDDESPRNDDTPINDTQDRDNFVDLQPRSELNQHDADFARNCPPESDEFGLHSTKSTDVKETSDKGRDVSPTCLDLLANTRLMSGMHVMVTGGPLYGSFGRIEKCLNGFCEVYLFMSKSFETVVRMISNEFLVPMIPDRDMKLKVEFVSEDAAIYFCPNKYEGTDSDGEPEWTGMKIWTVVNPALKQAMPEGSILEKINDRVVSDIKFEDLQAQFDKLTVPYSLTMQFPTGIQQIKMTELYMSELSLGAPATPVEKKTRVFTKEASASTLPKKTRKKVKSLKHKKRKSPRAFGRERRLNLVN